MSRRPRSRFTQKVSLVALAVAIVASLTGVAVATNANAAGSNPPACTDNGRKARVPNGIPVAGGHTYAEVNCSVNPTTVAVYANTSDGKAVDLRNQVGTIKAGRNFFVCGLPFGGSDINHIWVLTEADNYKWGWVRSKWLANTFDNGTTKGLPNCGKFQDAPNSAPVQSKSSKNYTLGVNSDVDNSGSCVPNGHNVKVPSYIPNYGGHIYHVVVCTNDLDNGGLRMNDTPAYNTTPVDALRTTQTFFVCGVTSGNENWLLTQGDDHLHWGWVPARYVHQTQDNGDPRGAHGGGTKGVPNCRNWFV